VPSAHFNQALRFITRQRAEALSMLSKAAQSSRIMRRYSSMGIILMHEQISKGAGMLSNGGGA